MRRGWLGSIVVVAVLGIAGPAYGGAFGGWYTGSDSGGSYTGTRANIYRYAFSPAQNGDVNEAVRIQGSAYENAGLLQMGYIKGGSAFSSNCGSNYTSVYVFQEHEYVGSGIYTCYLYDLANVNPPAQRFGVVHVPQYGATMWQTYLDGVVTGPYQNIGFQTGNPIAAGEWLSHYGHVDAEWGATGYMAWQESTTNGSSYTNIGSEAKWSQNTGDWVQDSPPSPFRLQN